MIDERLLESRSVTEINENFDRVLALVDTDTSALTEMAAALAQLEDAVKVTVTFDSDGVSSVSAQTIPYNTKATEPEDPTKSDYTFSGWVLDDEPFDFDTKVILDITLTATWTAVEDADE